MPQIDGVSDCVAVLLVVPTAVSLELGVVEFETTRVKEVERDSVPVSVGVTVQVALSENDGLEVQLLVCDGVAVLDGERLLLREDVGLIVCVSLWLSEPVRLFDRLTLGEIVELKVIGALCE